MAQYGITVEMIEAKAIQVVASGLHMFDRLIGNRKK